MAKKKHALLNIPPDVLLCLLLVTATFAVYLQVKDFDFVLFDDDTLILQRAYRDIRRAIREFE